MGLLLAYHHLREDSSEALKAILRTIAKETKAIPLRTDRNLISKETTQAMAKETELIPLEELLVRMELVTKTIQATRTAR